MGMAMAQRFDPQAGGGSPAPPMGPQTPPPPPPPPTPWFIVENGQSVGPFQAEQLTQAIAAGRVGADTLVWSAGMPEWTSAAQTPAVAAMLAAAPPPPPSS